MTDPSPEVVAAALALARADSAWYGGTDGDPEPGWDHASKAHFMALKAYRAAIAPKLRTRAEVDAEKLQVASSFFAGYQSEKTCRENWGRLCREETAPEPDPKPPPAPAPGYHCPKCGPIGPDIDDEGQCNRCGRFAEGAEPVDSCGCEASDALRDEVKELRQLLDFARRGAQDIVTVLEEGRK